MEKTLSTVLNKNIMRYIVVLIFLLFCFSPLIPVVHAAAPGGDTSTLDGGSLPPGIAKQIQKNGWADVLVVLDETGAKAFAAQQRKVLGLKYNNPATVAAVVPLLKKEKAAVLSRMSGQDYQVKGNYDHFPILFLRVNRGALAQLQRMGDVKAISENRALIPFTTCSGACTDDQTLIGIPDAWNYGSGQTGAGTSVAVLDTGVDYSLSAFGSCPYPGATGCSVVYEQCFATGGTGGATQCDADKSHGTNVQGTVLDVAPDTKLLSLDVFGTDGFAYDSDILDALSWVYSNYTTYNIVAENMSFGDTAAYTSTCPNDVLAVAISDLKSAGIASAVAAGNYGFTNALTSPACGPDAISVGAVYDKDYSSDQTWTVCSDTTPVTDQVACFSDSAPDLTILAPGVDITSAGITMSGTSQATPHVAGSVAVLKSQNSALTVDEEVARLKATGVNDTDSKSGVTTPRINLYDAVSVSHPIILASPSAFTFMSAEGGPNPADQTMNILNAGIGTMGWSLNSDQSWLTASSTSGTDAGSTNLQVDTSGLTAGTYTANAQITAAGAVNSPVTVPVTLDLVATSSSEDFETGDFSHLPWVRGGETGTTPLWEIDTGTVHTGTYSAEATGLSGADLTYLEVTLNVTSQDYVYFWVKTATSATSLDRLMLRIDGNNAGPLAGWSGNTDWTLVQSNYEVTPGYHTFRWEYLTTAGTSVSSDAVWIDDIFFPPSNTLVPDPSISPSSKNFGYVISGTDSSPFTFTVTNSGTADLVISSVELGGSDPGDFHLQNDNCTGDTVAPGGYCTVGVVFSPTSTGAKSALLTVYSNFPSSVSASLSGTGAVGYTLTVNKSGTGTGTVVSTDPAGGISCGADCSEAYADTTNVALSAAADTGSTFSGWSGCNSSVGNTCYVTMSGPVTVTATFDMIPPVADFTAAPSTTGDAPFYVTFTDTSTDNPTSWLWNFGDGETSTEQGPSHNFKTAGSYTVWLTAANAGGSNTMTKTDYITVNTCANDPAMVSGTGYPDLTSAYGAVADNGTVELQAVDFTEDVTLDRGVDVTFDGGYSCDYQPTPAATTINGSLTVTTGTLTVNGIEIQ